VAAGIRGERRLHWIEQALEPIAGAVDERSRRRLANALALCVGAEAFVVLRDLCGLEPAEAEETLRWAALALLSAATRGTKRRLAVADARNVSFVYEAILIGARCAGASTAILLARTGLDVLLVERAWFQRDRAQPR